MQVQIPSAAALLVLLLPCVAGCDGGSAGAAPGPAGSAAGAADEGPARLFCPEPEFDFGRVWEGTVVEHTFELEVQGEGELSLVAARGSCGCTVSELRRADGERYVFGTPLRAGERLALDVRFTSQGRQGPQDRPVKIYGNLPGDGRYQVGLVGEVGAYLSPETEVLALGELLPSEESIGTVRLTTADGQPARLEVQTLPPLPEDLHAELATADGRRDGPAAEWILAVRALGGGRIGAFDYPVRVDTLDEEGQATDVGATVFVAWSRVPPLEARPPVFPLPSLGPGRAASARVLLEAHVEGLDPAALDLSGARIEFDGAAASLGEAAQLATWSEGDRAGLELRLPELPEGLGRRLTGRVRVPVDHPDQVELEVRVDAPIAVGS